MFDPCETCLVNACCQIRQRPSIYKCGCEPYEIYRSKQMLEYFPHPESNARQNIIQRLKELKNEKPL